MESLQTLNPKKDTASNSQIMFLCLHAGGMTLIPVSIIAIRASMGSQTPTDIFLPCMIATFAATMAAMIVVSLYQKINLLNPIVIAYVGGISAIIALLVWYLTGLSKEGLDEFSKVLSNGIILLIFLAIVLGAVYKKINVFDAFIDGAKEGFTTCVKIIPYLVGMLIAISLLRTSGVFDVIIDGMKWFANVANLDTRFVDGLPTAPHQTAFRIGCARNDGGYDDDFRSGQLPGQTGRDASGQFGYHVLCDCRLFWCRSREKYAICCSCDAFGRSCRRYHFRGFGVSVFWLKFN